MASPQRPSPNPAGGALRVLAIGCLVTGMSWPSAAGAETRQERSSETESHPVRVFYRGSEGGPASPCFSPDQMQESVTAVLRRRVFFPAGESDVVVTVTAPTLQTALVAMSDADGNALGRRVLTAQSCGELAELVGFALSVMVDFRSDEVTAKREQAARAQAAQAASGGDASVAEVSKGSDSPDPIPKDQDPVTPPPPPPAQPRADAGASGGAQDQAAASSMTIRWAIGPAFDSGLSPEPLWGVFGQGLVDAADSWSVGVRLRGQHMPSVVRAFGDLAAWRVAVTLTGCWGADSPGEVGVRACLGATPDVVWVAATGFVAARTTAVWGLGVEPSFEVLLPLTSELELDIGAGVGVPVVRNDWHAASAAGESSLFRAPAVRALGFAGLAW